MEEKIKETEEAKGQTSPCKSYITYVASSCHFVLKIQLLQEESDSFTEEVLPCVTITIIVSKMYS